MLMLNIKEIILPNQTIFIMTQDKTIILHTYNDMAEAIMIQDKLKENGIESYLNDENVMGLDPVGGVELKIFEKDKEAAEKIITG
jgi:Putative prokaryotic signal transducing protein